MTTPKREGRDKTQTALDLLESIGAIEDWLAKDVRRLYSKWDSSNGDDPDPLGTEDGRETLKRLLGAVMGPSQPRVRKAHAKATYIALEHAYWRARGETSPTQRTANNWGVSVKTVSSAARKHPDISSRNFKDPLAPGARLIFTVVKAVRETMKSDGTVRKRK